MLDDIEFYFSASAFSRAKVLGIRNVSKLIISLLVKMEKKNIVQIFNFKSSMVEFNLTSPPDSSLLHEFTCLNKQTENLFIPQIFYLSSIAS